MEGGINICTNDMIKDINAMAMMPLEEKKNDQTYIQLDATHLTPSQEGHYSVSRTEKWANFPTLLSELLVGGSLEQSWTAGVSFPIWHIAGSLAKASPWE